MDFGGVRSPCSFNIKQQTMIDLLLRNQEWLVYLVAVMVIAGYVKHYGLLIPVYGLRDHSKIRWKESYKKVLGLDRPTEPGLDV